MNTKNNFGLLKWFKHSHQTLAFLAILLPSISNAQVPTNGLISHWKFSKNLKDYEGANHGSEFGTVSFGNDRFGNQLSALELAENGYVDCGVRPSLNFQDHDFTISVWINVPFYPGKEVIIVGKDGGEMQFRLSYDSDFKNKSVRRARIVASDQFSGTHWNEIDGYDLDTDSIIPVRKWIHLAATHEGDLFKMYFNGKLQAIEQLVGFDMTENDNKVTIGSLKFTGLIDDVRAYNLALSDAEIMELFKEDPNAQPTGVKEDLTNNNISIYPNPASTEIHIDNPSNLNLNNCSIELSSLTGTVVYNEQIEDSNATLSLPSLSKGIYFLTLRNTNSQIISVQKLSIN